MTALPTCLRNGRSGDVIVFLHGIGGNAEYWEPQLSFFGKSFQAVAWNMPGYGGSQPLSEMHFPALAASLDRLLDTFTADKFHLVGHSMGGMVAQEFMLLQAKRVSSLTLYASSSAFGKADGEWQQNFVRQRLKPLDEGGGMEEVASQMVHSLFGENPAPHLVEKAAGSISMCPQEVYRSAVKCLVGFDRRENLARIQLPTLLICGDQDNLAPPKLLEKMAAKITDSRFKCLTGAGHLASLEQAEKFNEILLEFITPYTDSANPDRKL